MKNTIHTRVTAIPERPVVGVGVEVGVVVGDEVGSTD